eukprot:9524490-Lingulodinium_polyedra.AAC.1
MGSFGSPIIRERGALAIGERDLGPSLARQELLVRTAQGARRREERLARSDVHPHPCLAGSLPIVPRVALGGTGRPSRRVRELLG